MSSIRVRAAVVLAMSGALGCAHGSDASQPPACAEPEPLRVLIDTSDRLNRDETGRSLPVTLRLFQLRGSAKLEGATFDNILEKAQEVLEGDLLATEEMTLTPSSKSERQMVRLPGATYLGVVAFLRQPTGFAWRAIAPLRRPDSAHCQRKGGGFLPVRVHIEDNRLEVQL